MIEPLVWGVATLAATRHLTTAAIYLLALHGTTPQQRPAIIKALSSRHRKAP